MTAVDARTVASVLPYKDLYAVQAYGAVSLCVADAARYSALNHQVLGKAFSGEALSDGHFQPVHYRPRWYQSETQCYAKACAKSLAMIKPPFIVECHNRPNMVSYLKHATKAPLILHFHNDPQTMKGAMTPQARATLYEQCDALVFNGHYTRRRFFDGLGEVTQDPKRVIVYYQGFDFARFDCAMNQKQKQIIFVGKLVPEKGALPLAQALVQLLPQFPEWSVLWVVPRVGKVSAYQRAFETCHAALGAQSKVLAYLPHEAVLQAFAASEVACLPSIWEEPYGRVVMEAMAMGCACITSQRGGIPEIAGDAAFLLGEVSSGALANALHVMLSQADRRHHLQQQARARMKAHFDLQSLSQSLDAWRLTIFESILFA